ncbi:MAG: hypothetical protein AAFV86_12640 [Pseudomonadota bacterium]
MVVLIAEIGGVMLMALAWMVAITRMIETRQWSPMRPAVMVVVMAGCLMLMGETLLDYAQTGELRSTFYVAAWNLGMALFDCKIALVLSRRGALEQRLTEAGLAAREAVETASATLSGAPAPMGETGSGMTRSVAKVAARPY